jgi:hypothetical protein
MIKTTFCKQKRLCIGAQPLLFLLLADSSQHYCFWKLITSVSSSPVAIFKMYEPFANDEVSTVKLFVPCTTATCCVRINLPATDNTCNCTSALLLASNLMFNLSFCRIWKYSDAVLILHYLTSVWAIGIMTVFV